MTKSGTNSQKPSWGQLGVLAGFIIDFLATLLTFSEVEYWLGHKSELKKKLREVFSITGEFSETRAEWQKFYKTHFGWDVDFSKVVLPMVPTNSNWRLIFIPKGMTLNFAFSICEKLFKSWKYDENLNEAVPRNIRNTDNHYAIWVRGEVEPDQEFLGKSICQTDPDMKIGITLLERIIFGIKYFTETGNYIDLVGMTFCSGSRDVDGHGVCVYLNRDGKFYVNYCSLDDSGDRYGIRSVVSL